MVIELNDLPAGVQWRPLTSHVDARGSFAEVFRAEWDTGIDPVQWNIVVSRARVLRGVHVHRVHADYFILLSGRASIGLRDLRPDSPTHGCATVVDVSGDSLTALVIPPGVAHGFYFHEESRHLYSVSEYFNAADELGCHWSDPDLGIPWPFTEAITSSRDAQAPSLGALVHSLGNTV